MWIKFQDDGEEKTTPEDYIQINYITKKNSTRWHLSYEFNVFLFKHSITSVERLFLFNKCSPDFTQIFINNFSINVGNSQIANLFGKFYAIFEWTSSSKFFLFYSSKPLFTLTSIIRFNFWLMYCAGVLCIQYLI